MPLRNKEIAIKKAQDSPGSSDRRFNLLTSLASRRDSHFLIRSSVTNTTSLLCIGKEKLYAPSLPISTARSVSGRSSVSTRRWSSCASAGLWASPCPYATVSRMKYDRQLGLSEYFVQRVCDTVIGKELLHRRMKLESMNFAGSNQSLGLCHAIGAAVRIDANEGDGTGRSEQCPYL